MSKDYYAILGVEPDATLEEIKSAYRRRAKALHPDCSDEDGGPIRAVYEAYAVLSDPARRRAYADVDHASDDELARGSHPRVVCGGSRPEPLRPRRAPVEPLSPLETPREQGWVSPGRDSPGFDALFDRVFDLLGAEFAASSWSGTRRAEPIRVELSLMPQQAARGGRVRVAIPVRRRCPTCLGRGWLGFTSCHRCFGTGVVEEEHPVSLAFPAGVRDGDVFTIPLDGAPGQYLTLRFRVGR